MLKEKYPVWNDDCIWCTIQEDRQEKVFIANISNNTPGKPFLQESTLKLNEEGGKVWQLCDGSRKITEIIDFLHNLFEVPHDVLEKDVLGFINNFSKQKLLFLHDDVHKKEIRVLTGEERLKRADNIMWNEIEGSVMLMDNQTGEIFELPPFIQKIWKFADGSFKVDELIMKAKEELPDIQYSDEMIKFNLLICQHRNLFLLS